MNGGQAMYLVEALSPYFTGARSLQVYAVRMVGRTIELQRPADPTPEQSALKSNNHCVEEIQLEYDNLVVSCWPGTTCALSWQHFSDIVIHMNIMCFKFPMHMQKIM